MDFNNESIKQKSEKEDVKAFLKSQENIIMSPQNDNQLKISETKEIPNKEEIDNEKVSNPNTKFKITFTDDAVNFKKIESNDDKKNYSPLIQISDNKKNRKSINRKNSKERKEKIQNVKTIEFTISEKYPHQNIMNNKNTVSRQSQKNKNSKKYVSNPNTNNKEDDNKKNKEIPIPKRKSKTKIFNNKKNNENCSNLLKNIMKNEKELIIMPYAKEKQKKNKTINTIGAINGISYPKISIYSGGNNLNSNANIMNIIRVDDKLIRKGKKSHKLFRFKRPSSTKIKIDFTKDNFRDDSCLRKMLENSLK